MLLGQWHVFELGISGMRPGHLLSGLACTSGPLVASLHGCLLDCVLLLAHKRHWQHSMLLAALSSSGISSVFAAVW
jgi:hypothetical protein